MDRSQTILANMPLAMHFMKLAWASGHFRRICSPEDLLQECYVALIVAIDSLPPGQDFARHASKVMGTHLRTYNREGGLIRVQKSAFSTATKERYPARYEKAVRTQTTFAEVSPQTEELLGLLSREPSAEDKVFLEEVLVLVSKLPAEERSIVIERFGLSGQKPATLRELAARRGCSCEQIRQKQIIALGRLKRNTGLAA